MHPSGVGELHDSDPEQHELLEALRRATIGEYDVYSQLGRGGMATVFLALELSLNRPVAIKVMSPSALNHKTLVDRFWLEARTAASLSHPHVIPIYAVRSVGGLHYFVMKHVDGASLDVVLKKEGPLPLSLVTTILGQVSGALAYAHRRGVVHRDVKPANIMLDNEGFAIVMDFGIAKVRDIAALTTPGIMVGTPLYMSPEQISGGDIDGRSDQYSLGVVAFEMLTGRRPFSGETMPEILRGHFVDTPPDVRELRLDCPVGLAAAIRRMMCKESSDRFPSLEAVSALISSISRPDDDEVREKMSSLARSISSPLPRISQPMSPLPVSNRKQPDQRRASRPLLSETGRNAISAIRHRPFVSSALALAVALSVGALSLMSPTRSVPSDSDLSQLRKVGTSLPRITSEEANPLIVPPSASAGRASVTDSSSLSSTAAPIEKRPGRSVPSPNRPEPERSLERAQDERPIPKRKTITSPTKTSEPVRNKVDTKEAAILYSESGPPPAPSAGFVTPQPPPILIAPAGPGVVRIGSRIPEAGLYVDGSFVSLIGALRTVSHKPGQIHIQIKAEDCITWDTVIFIGPADTAQIGFRNPRCTR